MHSCTLTLGAVGEIGDLTLDLSLSRMMREMRWRRCARRRHWLLLLCCCCIPRGRFGLVSDLASVEWFRVILYLWNLHGKGPADGRFGATPP
jgi:hypothetical protein